MRQVNIHEAKTHLSQLVEAAEAGESIILARAGKPVALLSPLPPVARRLSGLLKGQIWIGDDFDAPLPESNLAEFEGDAD
jgi:prevent-host-death family protein